jgi:hypothetical protein
MISYFTWVGSQDSRCCTISFSLSFVGRGTPQQQEGITAAGFSILDFSLLLLLLAK